MRIILDTNILLVSISPVSRFFPIFKAFQEEKIELCVTTEILMEYEEILTNHVGVELSDLILQLIENAPNTTFITRFYQWNLIEEDLDDNKFIDCYIAASADYLITHDKHFNVLDSISFPKIKTMTASKFIEKLI